MNNPKPLVAIIMATYNGADFIREQIDSILRQRDVDVHFYISDDGSRDETLAILHNYFQQYPQQFKKLFEVKFHHPAKNFLSILPKIT